MSAQVAYKPSDAYPGYIVSGRLYVSEGRLRMGTDGSRFMRWHGSRACLKHDRGRDEGGAREIGDG